MEQSTQNYFQVLNQSLKNYKRAIPSLIIDLDRLDHNIQTLEKSLSKEMDFRIVLKSLPSIPLVNYIMEKTRTKKLMLFHQPFLSSIAEHYGAQVDILMGKPMPVQTAAYFYKNLDPNSPFQASKQLQWLIDNKERLLQYLELAKKEGQKIQVNLEIDVGLHRGGFADLEDLKNVLRIIDENKDFLDFAGFMGYDPHVALMPKILRSSSKAFRLANDFYKACIDLVKNAFPKLWKEGLCFNGAGSPTLALHQNAKSTLNEVSAGSALVKPTHFDLPSLDAYQAACFIATPILKKMEGTTLPALEKMKGFLSFLKASYRKTYFIYGGYWKAEYHFPPKTGINPLFGESTNQSMVNSASKIDLEVDDFIFLRPTQSEFVFLQFGNILLTRGAKIVGEWEVLSN